MNVSSEVWKWIFKVTKDTFILSLQSAAHNTTAFLDISLGYATMCSLFIGKTNRRRGEDWRNMLEYWPFFACPHKEIDIAIMLLEELFCFGMAKKIKLDFFSIYTPTNGKTTDTAFFFSFTTYFIMYSSFIAPSSLMLLTIFASAYLIASA